VPLLKQLSDCFETGELLNTELCISLHLSDSVEILPTVKIAAFLLLLHQIYNYRTRGLEIKLLCSEMILKQKMVMKNPGLTLHLKCNDLF